MPVGGPKGAPQKRHLEFFSPHRSLADKRFSGASQNGCSRVPKCIDNPRIPRLYFRPTHSIEFHAADLAPLARRSVSTTFGAYAKLTGR